MAAVAVSAAFATRVVYKSEGRYSRSDFSSCSLSLQPVQLVEGWMGNGSGMRLRLEHRAQLLRGMPPRRANVAKASAYDADDMDDEGVVKDMERYLNELSVEYENVWDTKPAWCQPWTIVLTGVTGISLSWLVIKSTIVTGIVTVLVAAWWYLFLYTYPLAYTEMIAERRRNQKNGTEDTYGLRIRK